MKVLHEKTALSCNSAGIAVKFNELFFIHTKHPFSFTMPIITAPLKTGNIFTYMYCTEKEKKRVATKQGKRERPGLVSDSYLRIRLAKKA